jgi:hypothetical protein
MDMQAVIEELLETLFLVWIMLKLYTVEQWDQDSASEVLHNSQSHQTVKYDGSLVTQNQEWLCCKSQQKFTQLTRTVQVTLMRQKNIVTSPTGSRIKNNCAGEDQNQFIWLTRRVRVSPSQNSVRVVRQKNMIMGPVGPGIKNECAGKCQQ